MEYYSITNLHTLVVRKHFQLKLLSIFSDLQYTFHNFIYSAILPDHFMSIIIKPLNGKIFSLMSFSNDILLFNRRFPPFVPFYMSS